MSLPRPGHGSKLGLPIAPLDQSGLNSVIPSLPGQTDPRAGLARYTPWPWNLDLALHKSFIVHIFQQANPIWIIFVKVSPPFLSFTSSCFLSFPRVLKEQIEWTEYYKSNQFYALQLGMIAIILLPTTTKKWSSTVTMIIEHPYANLVMISRLMNIVVDGYTQASGLEHFLPGAIEHDPLI